jgi:hypothetical protein
LFADDVFRSWWKECNVSTGAFGAPAWSRAADELPQPPPALDEEALIERIAERVAQKLRDSLVG